MYWIFSLVGALLVGALLMYVVAVVFGRGQEMPPAPEDPVEQQRLEALRDLPITSQACDKVRFRPALRGYRPQEVDEYLQRIAQQLALYEEQMSRTQAQEVSRDTDS